MADPSDNGMPERLAEAYSRMVKLAESTYHPEVFSRLLSLRAPGGQVSRAEVTGVNGKPISALPVLLTGTGDPGVTRGLVEFKALSKHFVPGMNRFDVRAGDMTAEVLLEIEF